MTFFGCESKEALYEMRSELQRVTLMEALQVCSRLLGDSDRTEGSLSPAGEEIAWVE